MSEIVETQPGHPDRRALTSSQRKHAKVVSRTSARYRSGLYSTSASAWATVRPIASPTSPGRRQGIRHGLARRISSSLTAVMRIARRSRYWPARAPRRKPGHGGALRHEPARACKHVEHARSTNDPGGRLMGLYLCVFSAADGADLEGVDPGSYADFGAFRTTVAERLEGGQWGTRFPVLMLHSDCDGEWSPAEAAQLGIELAVIQQELSVLPPAVFVPGTWQAQLAGEFGLQPSSLADSFIDVNGESLLDRLADLATFAVALGRPISFQ